MIVGSSEPKAITTGASGPIRSSMSMSFKKFTIEAESLDAARARIAVEVPADYYVVQEKKDKEAGQHSCRGVGYSVELARSDARRKVPPDHTILELEDLSPSQELTLQINAYDEHGIQSQVRAKVDSSFILRNVALSKAGSKGFLGIGKSPNQYEVKLLRPATAKVTYATKAKLVVDTVRETDFLESLKSSDPKERDWAVSLLRDMRDSRAVGFLGGLLLGRNAWDVRKAAAAGLGEIGRCFCQCGEGVVEHLINALKDSDKEVLKAVFKALSLVKSPLATQRIIDEMADREVLESVLCQALDHADPGVRKAGLKALVRHGLQEVESVKWLQKAFYDPDEYVRDNAKLLLVSASFLRLTRSEQEKIVVAMSNLPLVDVTKWPQAHRTYGPMIPGDTNIEHLLSSPREVMGFVFGWDSDEELSWHASSEAVIFESRYKGRILGKRWVIIREWKAVYLCYLSWLA